MTGNKDIYGRCEDVQTYRDKDLNSYWFNEAIRTSKGRWSNRITSYVKENGDRGACTLGAGIYVWYVPPKCRKPRPRLILAPPAATQGEHAWTHSAQDVVDYLKSQDIYCWFNNGRLD